VANQGMYKLSDQGMFKVIKQDITKGIYQLTDGSFTG
jgi:hypothetical protein